MKLWQHTDKSRSMAGRIRSGLLICALMLAAALLTGCAGRKDGRNAEDTIVEVKSDYTAQQIYLMLGSMHEAVAGTYTEDVFTAVVDGMGGTYDEKFTGIMHDYIVKLTLMKAMIDERGLKLTSDEERAVGKLADQYMEDLQAAVQAGDAGSATDQTEAAAGTGADTGAAAASVDGITGDDAVKIFTEQMLLPKLREDIMGGYDIEISESEARVMDISMIVTDSSDKAGEAMNQISDGKDFAQVAGEYSIQEETEMAVCREDLPETIADTIFEMEDGAVSPVMQSGGKYYIIRCDTGYDVEKTALRKQQLTKQRRSESVGTAYRQFCENHECVIDEETWTAALQLYKAGGALPDIFGYMDED